MSWLNKKTTTLFFILILVIGLGLLCYPTFADWWNSFHQSHAVASYAENVSLLDDGENEAMWDAAVEYNRDLARAETRWLPDEEQMERYNNTLNVSGSGIMGFLDIPKIGVTLPIYHGTDEAVIQIAIGHLSGSSLPVGGEGSHCVVSSHRGLPSARLFTDLDKLTTGDTWTLNVLNHTLTYEVDQVRIVEPSDLSNLEIEEGKDYCTLVTCTPYGINTHRMLVRGHRVENAKGHITVLADAVLVDPLIFAAVLAVPVLVLLFIWVMVGTDVSSHKRRVRKKTKERFRMGE